MLNKQLNVHLCFSALENNSVNWFGVFLFLDWRELFLQFLKIFYKGFLFAAFWGLRYFFDWRQLEIPLIDEVCEGFRLFSGKWFLMKEILGLTARSGGRVGKGKVTLLSIFFMIWCYDTWISTLIGRLGATEKNSHIWNFKLSTKISILGK